jgi:hypothetical protein
MNHSFSIGMYKADRSGSVVCLISMVQHTTCPEVVNRGAFSMKDRM